MSARLMDSDALIAELLAAFSAALDCIDAAASAERDALPAMPEFDHDWSNSLSVDHPDGN